MKIILTGATGVVGLECLRIALLHPDVKEVIALGRRPVSVPEGSVSETEKARLRNVVVKDMGTEYPQEIKDQLKGADACIWYVICSSLDYADCLTTFRNLAITPKKYKEMTPEEAKKICHDYTLVGLQSMLSVANPDRPFRFIYTSGAMTERDQDRKDLWIIGDYRRMRVRSSNRLLSKFDQIDLINCVGRS